jgi:hypothetical protein
VAPGRSSSTPGLNTTSSAFIPLQIYPGDSICQSIDTEFVTGYQLIMLEFGQPQELFGRIDLVDVEVGPPSFRDVFQESLRFVPQNLGSRGVSEWIQDTQKPQLACREVMW